MALHRLLFISLLAGCASQPTTAVEDLPGARNVALREASSRHHVPVDWLAAVGYTQGRFEIAQAEDTEAPPPDTDALLDDTPLDDTGDPVVTDDAPAGDHGDRPDTWGVMGLTDDQVAAAAQLTGTDPEAIRTDIAANIDATAALLASGDLREATAQLLGIAGDPDSTALALGDLDDIVANGFDVTTSDGEHLVLDGASPALDTAEAVAPGHYPAIQWIPSPNYSSRLGYSIKYIVIHDIEGTQAGAIATFKSSARQASAHYILRAHDGHIVQMVHEGSNAWHAGHAWFNRHSIGIEHEGFAFKKAGGGYYTETQYQASARLACAIAHRYSIPINRAHIFGHFNVPSNLASHTLCSDARGIAGQCGGVSHHADPGRYWNWTKYMTLVRNCVNAI